MDDQVEDVHELTVPPCNLVSNVLLCLFTFCPLACAAVIHEGGCLDTRRLRLIAPKRAAVWIKQPDLFASFDRSYPSKQQRSSKLVHVLIEGSSSFCRANDDGEDVSDQYPFDARDSKLTI